MKGIEMVEIHRKEIVINTDEGDIRLSFSPTQPRGYRELIKAVTGFDEMRKEAVQLSKGNKALAGAFVIDGEMKTLEEIKEALKTALLPAEWEKIAGIVDYIDIRGMLEIATAILNAYTSYYNSRLTDGMEA